MLLLCHECQLEVGGAWSWLAAGPQENLAGPAAALLQKAPLRRCLWDLSYPNPARRQRLTLTMTLLRSLRQRSCRCLSALSPPDGCLVVPAAQLSCYLLDETVQAWVDPSHGHMCQLACWLRALSCGLSAAVCDCLPRSCKRHNNQLVSHTRCECARHT